MAAAATAAAAAAAAAAAPPPWLLLFSLMVSVTPCSPRPPLTLRPPDRHSGVWDQLLNWDLQTLGEGASKAGLLRGAWQSLAAVWPGPWGSPESRLLKRNMVVADDAAFREKNKLLTAMERQKWLNSYMHKLLVVNS